MESTAPQPSDWDQRWVDGKIAFHEHSVNRILLDYEDIFMGDSQLHHVFVPLAGKTIDMAYLAGKGHRVSAVEFSEKAVNDFFLENKISYSRTQIMDGIVLYSGFEERIRIFCCDMFHPHLNIELIGPFDRVWDRASLIAMHPKDQQLTYATKMKQLVEQSAKILCESPIHYLLATVDYPQDQMMGPPFSVGKNKVTEYYSFMDIQILREQGDQAKSQRWKTDYVTEFVFLFTKNTTRQLPN
eukprot:TRINITY_DN4607_c0_g1_i3.p1 TRINITY_DN4607_c0_g1~~TRINITY_DN4607_c0_g1_i3.p1  ORF type:complete len:242 (-),score=55.95 TRINITY_DN4607_c0_g1_i3:1079-1804(-)